MLSIHAPLVLTHCSQSGDHTDSAVRIEPNRVTEIQSKISWLPCKFIDEEVTLTTKGPDTKHIYRSSVVQFGLKDDAPVNPNNVTFLITPSKLDVRQFLGSSEAEQLSCEVQRYSTDGSHVRWPVKGEHEYNRWFTLNLSHSENLFKILGFMRQSTDQPPTGQHDYKSWSVIKDKDILITTVVMVMQTQTPVVKSLLKFQPELHCQFSIDHKAPKVTVQWRKLGRYILFKHDSTSGQTQGSGVNMKQLATGGATYTAPLTEVGSGGTYMCSVGVHPLDGSLTVKLQIEEPPRVSLNVDPALTLSEDAERRIVCRADGYYPLDVNILWSHKGSTEVGPKVDSAQLSSHRTNPDGTYSLFAFFYLKPKLWDSGRKFTCSVSHQTLSTPVRKTFTLTVTEPGQWMLIFNVVCLVVVFVVFLRYVCKVKKPWIFF
ncbi:hypothetical protein WMY93_028998 [Mugilogobius chulae]|uniref:Ig-like domain-containing protein n=1 Tax=Mugilogobius chulae TaxID=88201 RepID=A0AAW0MU33_9GOBI